MITETAPKVTCDCCGQSVLMVRVPAVSATKAHELPDGWAEVKGTCITAAIGNSVTHLCVSCQRTLSAVIRETSIGIKGKTNVSS